MKIRFDEDGVIFLLGVFVGAAVCILTAIAQRG